MTVRYSKIKSKYQRVAEQVPRRIQKVLKRLISDENGLPELISNDRQIFQNQAQIPNGCPTGTQEAPKGAQNVDF